MIKVAGIIMFGLALILAMEYVSKDISLERDSAVCECALEGK